MSDTMSMNFWKRAKVEVTRNNTTFRWLAERIGVSETTMSGWRKTGVLPRADHALLIASLLDVSLTYLVTGEDSQTPDLRPQEREILKMVKGLSDTDLRVVSSLVRAYVGEKEIDLSTQTAG